MTTAADDRSRTTATPADPRALTARQFANLGVWKMAYVRAVTIDGMPAFVIHAANGLPMAMAAEHDVALATIVQHRMVPATLH